MNQDMTVPCEDGLINIRVGAIIMKKGKILMVANKIRPEYMYSVGGRIKFGESSEQAVVREVFEETGYKLEVDRLGFVQENYFYGDAATNMGKVIYEISFFYYMKVPENFEPVCTSFTEDEGEEYLTWIDPEDPITYYPQFFRTELKKPFEGVKYYLTDDRK